MGPMTALIALLTVVLLFSVVFVISAPFRRRALSPESQDPERDDLEAARAAKYREIRDAELDFRTGKLSREDYEAVDGSLRAEAVEILDRLEPGRAEDARDGGTRGVKDPQPDSEVDEAKPQVDA